MPLVVCATPIGNLEDVTLRVLRELREADLVLCEDTRRTRALLDRYGIRTRTMSYHRHSEARRGAELLPLLESGRRVALVSDAGLPGINDPGTRLIDEARTRGIEVTVLPGPSAVETALVASGLASGRYTFVGYLPRTEAARTTLWGELAETGGAAVAFESPKRLGASLASLAARDPGRPVAVCRELTKRFEEIVRGSASELAERYAEPPRGEVTVVVAPPAGSGTTERGERPLAAVAELVAAGVSRRRAAQIVSGLTGVPANTLYRGSLSP